MIRAIIFDLDGTLIDRAQSWLRCVEGFIMSHSQDFPMEEAVCLLRDIPQTMGGPFLHHGLLARIIAQSYPELGMSVAAVAADLAARLPGCIEPDPAVARMLDELSGRYTTVILSNGSRHLQQAKIMRAGLKDAVGGIFISGAMGVRKPDPSAFERVLGWAKVAPHEALIVGDHPFDDIRGGRRAGLQTCAVGTRYEERWPKPDFKIDRILDLPGVLP